ncbi:MAG: hypothetical protein ABIJ26_00360 [Candidatus Margulisiibacteriota bacterium]
MKKIMVLLSLICLLALGIFVWGCSQSSGGGDSTTNYKITGTCAQLSTASAALAKSTTSVTHIVAVGSNNATYSADLSGDSFTIDLDSGKPYALGFFNKTGSTITLLGYLRQSEVDWDSIPLMSPSSTSTDLGETTVTSGTLDVTASISTTDFLTAVDMDTATANYYGEIDNPMKAFTNLDVDGNGVFDFDEGKAFMLYPYINMGPNNDPAPGQLDKMLAGYNDDYEPGPNNYEFYFAVQGVELTNGSTATLTVPSAVTDSSSNESTTLTGTIASDSSGSGKVCFLKFTNGAVYGPSVPPSGTYSLSVDGSTFTFSNMQGTNVVALAANDGIIYPVFHLVTNDVGIITAVNYQWKKLSAGTVSTPTLAEVKAAVEMSTTTSTAFIHDSPVIEFYYDWTSGTRDGSAYLSTDALTGTVDVSGLGVDSNLLDVMSCYYNLSSRVVCKFFFR